MGLSVACGGEECCVCEDCASQGGRADTLLALQVRMIGACRSFVDAFLIDVPPDTSALRSVAKTRHEGPPKRVAGWRVHTESTRWGMSGMTDIVLLPSGEIFTERGTPKLSADVVMEDPWVVLSWMSGLKDSHELTRWPTGAEDLRRLAIDFHLANSRSAAPARGRPTPESAAARSRQFN